MKNNGGRGMEICSKIKLNLENDYVLRGDGEAEVEWAIILVYSFSQFIRFLSFCCYYYP